MSGDAGGKQPRRVVREVAPASLVDLLDRPPRATLAVVDGGRVDVLPVQVQYRADAVRFGIPPGARTDFVDRDVVLLVDDGAFWFELRGVSVRGRARPVEAGAPAAVDGLVWYAIEPRRVLAWDYNSLREA